MNDLATAPVRIICLGNELVGDDGAGIRVGRVLLDLPLPERIQVIVRPRLGFEILEYFQGDGTVILVDAMRTGAAAGTCSVLNLSELSALQRTPYCCHMVGLSDMLELAQRTSDKPTLPHIVGVTMEGTEFGKYCTKLTEATQRALPEAVTAVLELAGASNELLIQGKQRALLLSDWSPAPGDAW